MEYKNLLIIYDYAYVNGGSARVAIQSALALSRTGKYKVYFFSAVGPICEELLKSKVVIRNLDMTDINTENLILGACNGIWNSKAKKELEIFLRINKLLPNNTIVHVHGFDKALSSSVIYAVCKYKIFLTVHDYSIFCPNGGLYNYKDRRICEFAPMSKNCIFCNCDKRSYAQKIWRIIRQIVKNRVLDREIVYIAISELSEKLIRKNMKIERLIRIPDLIVDYNKKIKNSIANNYNYIYVGRISEEKGVELFCEAISDIKESYPWVEGFVIGGGDNLEQLSEQFPKIYFEGWKNKKGIFEYISNARMLIFPSKCYETAGLTVLESLAIGTPCIVGDNTAAVEFIKEGESGFLFPGNRLDGLERVIEKSLDNSLIEHMNSYLQNTYTGMEFKEELHIQRLIEIYERIIVEKDELGK